MTYGGESAANRVLAPSSKEREELRSAFRQDAINAWDAYQATGLHGTFKEADAWLPKLQAGQDGELLKFHV